MSTHDLHDTELEERLRAVLASRAGSVTGPPPDLALAPPLGAAPSAGRRAAPGRRHVVRWAAAAAAVALVAVGAVRVLDPGTGHVRTGAEPGEPTASTSTTAAADPTDGRVNPAAAELPATFDLTSATPVFDADGDAEAVARAYLVDRLGDGADEIEAQLTADLVLSETASGVTGVTALDFDQDGDGLEDLPTGTVFLRQDAERWRVVAAVTDGLSLASLDRTATLLSGVAVGDHAQDENLRSLWVVVSDPATGAVLAEDMSDPAGRTETSTDVAVVADPGDVPALVTVKVAGGRTLGITELMSEPVADEPADGAPKAFWWGSGDGDPQREDPETAVRAFAASVSPPLPVASAEAGEDPGESDHAAVMLVLDGGLEVTVDLRRDVGGWVVTGLQDRADLATAASAEMAGPNGTLPIRSLRLGLPDDVVSADLTTWVDGEPATQHLEGAALDAGPDEMHIQGLGVHYAIAEFDPPRAISRSLLVGRDAEGTIATVQAGIWE